MPWSRGHVKAAAIAAKAAGWNDEHVRLVLRWFGNRAVHKGRVTRTSPSLNNDDLEFYMATAEADAGGVLPGWKPGYWHAQAGRVIQRQRHAILELAGDLNYPEAYLAGVIDKATAGRAGCIEDIDRLNDRAVAGKVIDALKYKLQHAKHEPSATSLRREPSYT